LEDPNPLQNNVLTLIITLNEFEISHTHWI
jgi:hypothetical protein